MNYRVGDTVFLEDLKGNIDSFTIVRIDGDRLFDNNGSFINKSEALKKSDPRVIKYRKEHPIEVVPPSDIEMIPITWEDVRKLCTLSVHVEMDLGRDVSDKEHYSEVLRRFKEWKKNLTPET